MTLAEARKAARVDTAKMNDTTQADIERHALEDGTDDFRPFLPIKGKILKENPK